MTARTFEIRGTLETSYPDVYTPEALAALTALAPLDADRKAVMRSRIARRAARMRDRRRLAFLPPQSRIARTDITVQDARDGKFIGSEIPNDLRRQWIQGTGPAARPGATVETGLRNVAYALLSGADGWMFDGEDALGQVSTMSLDNQRNLKLAIHRDPVFMKVAEGVAKEMNAWAKGFFGRETIADWQKQLDFTTKIFRARGLHLDDRHVRHTSGESFSASIVDLVLYVANNQRRLLMSGASVALYLPKIQTAEEAALWNDMMTALEQHLGLTVGTIKVYVLVEQIEACFQLMEIRAALGPHFVGFNTGRWDYINSVSDAMAWEPEFVNPNIDAITMTYGYMRIYEDRVRRAVNTPDARGQYALWQGGMEPNIPVGSETGVTNAMKRAVAGGEREQREGASGKWVAHWKMVHIVRPVWEKVGHDNQIGRTFPPLTYDERRRRRSRAARDGAAHDSRRARSAERGDSVRQRLPAGAAGGGPQASRLLRQRRRAVSDGRHGHGRNPPEHPVGMAAQGRLADRRRRDRREGGRHLHARAVRHDCSSRSTTSCSAPATKTSTTSRSAPRCPSRARSSRPTSATP